MTRLPASFYLQDTLTVAKELIGCKLVHATKAGTISGIIVETEAYLETDPASHSFRGKSNRNAAMFGPAGTAYIYQIYGLHYCLNAVTGPEGTGEAVLIRALEPVDGTELMQTYRPRAPKQLCSGPAKLVQALHITPDLNGASLRGDELFTTPRTNAGIHITAATRIGITKGAEQPWRFCQTDSPFLSRPARLQS